MTTIEKQIRDAVAALKPTVGPFFGVDAKAIIDELDSLRAHIAEMERDLATSQQIAKDMIEAGVEGIKRHVQVETLGELERLRRFADDVRHAHDELNDEIDESNAIGIALRELDRAVPAQAEPQAPHEHRHRFAPALISSTNWRPGHKFGPCLGQECGCERWDDGLITKDGEPVQVEQRPAERREGGE